MDKDGCPSVYVVDSHVTRPPVPPRLSRRQRREGVCQSLLILLVSLALCGMAIEACFIYRLYQPEPVSTASASKLGGDVTDDARPTDWPNYNNPPSKPVAHLTGGLDVVHGQQIMAWSMIADPLIYEMDYKDGGLIIKKEGYYYVYSKVFFSERGVFHHSVDLHTEKYSGKGITLLMSRKFSQRSSAARSNSYLGGVFHLDRDDALYVKVSNTTQIQQHKAFENVFGAFMI